MARLPDRLHAGPINLARWQVSFAEELAKAVRSSFPELNRWMHWAYTMPTVEDLRRELERGNQAFGAGTEWLYLMFELNGGPLVGGAGLHGRLEGTVEARYWVRTDRTRRGYATSAARALTDAVFTHLSDVQRVEIRMDTANAASAAVPRRLGYRLLGEVEREIVTSGHTRVGYVWLLDRARWEARRSLSGADESTPSHQCQVSEASEVSDQT